MKEAGQVIVEALVDAYYDFGLLMALNLLWLVASLPIFTLPPALAGLQYSVHRMVRARRSVSARETFFEGFRSCFWLGWRWILVNLLVLAALGANFLFYSRFSADWARWVQGIFLGMVVLWALIQIYTFPLLLEQEEQRLWLALRNSLVLFTRRPGFSLVLVLFIGLVATLSTLLALPWILFTASLSTYLVNRCTVYLVEELTHKKEGSAHVP